SIRWRPPSYEIPNCCCKLSSLSSEPITQEHCHSSRFSSHSTTTETPESSCLSDSSWVFHTTGHALSVSRSSKTRSTTSCSTPKKNGKAVSGSSILEKSNMVASLPRPVTCTV